MQRETASAMQHESHGVGVTAHPPRDETLQHPRCVYQVLKRHFARYTPEMVERTCGVSRAAFLEVCEAVTANSGRERTTALVYSVGWTQHSVGVQYIRTGAILQLLLGNMGRPGGGIMALRGHASIQGSTDIPTLFNLLPGYLPMPHAEQHPTLTDWIDSVRHPGAKGFWANAGAYGNNRASTKPGAMQAALARLPKERRVQVLRPLGLRRITRTPPANGGGLVG